MWIFGWTALVGWLDGTNRRQIGLFAATHCYYGRGGTMGGQCYYGKGWPLPAHCSDLDQSPAGLHLFVSLCIYVCTIHTILGIERVVCMLFQ